MPLGPERSARGGGLVMKAAPGRMEVPGSNPGAGEQRARLAAGCYCANVWPSLGTLKRAAGGVTTNCPRSTNARCESMYPIHLFGRRRFVTSVRLIACRYTCSV